MSKYGWQKGIQRFKCASCKKVFSGRLKIDNDIIWQQYIQGKQTYKQLAIKYNYSTKTIQRKIDGVETQRQTTFSSVVNVLMDTTYFGRKFG